MPTIDADKLRDYLVDYCGSAVCSGFPAAALDLFDIQDADGLELCRIAEKLGVDLASFAIDGKPQESGAPCSDG